MCRYFVIIWMNIIMNMKIRIVLIMYLMII